MKVFLATVCLCLALFAQSSGNDSIENQYIEALLAALEDEKITESAKDMIRIKLIELGHVFSHERTKREVRDGSQYCCKIVDTRTPDVFPRTGLREVTEVREETRESCSKTGVCELVTTKVHITTIKTFQDFSQAKIVPQGEEPCPETLITCCNGFFFFGPVDNCVNFPDFRELLDIFSRFPDLAQILNPPVVVALANAGPSGLE